ncbi:HNH endonuclease [Rubritalea sp.]|uniref:HNH endonuclease n=1 Tax=Rubritalea sp. TaxID=2109375 RepID=UPI003EF60442
MPKIIFTSGVTPQYDDIPEVRCEFPKRYLKAVTEAIGDWVIYYEPRKNGGRMSYFASARVQNVIEHPTKAEHYYMCVTDYLDFHKAVKFRDGHSYLEQALRREDGLPNQGMLGWSVRRLPEHEFTAILQAGFSQLTKTTLSPRALAEEPATYNRPTIQQLVSRSFRDKAFRDNIHDAYDETCSFTGLRLSNGKGRYEVEAAHIRAVNKQGPDSSRNGLALNRTIHWLFDRGLLSLEDDGKILQVKELIPTNISMLLHADSYARFPEEPHLKPHSQFLRYHRENCFVG